MTCKETNGWSVGRWNLLLTSVALWMLVGKILTIGITYAISHWINLNGWEIWVYRLAQTSVLENNVMRLEIGLIECEDSLLGVLKIKVVRLFGVSQTSPRLCSSILVSVLQYGFKIVREVQKKMVQGVRNISYEGRLKVLKFHSLERRRVWGNFKKVSKWAKGFNKGGVGKVLTVNSEDKTRSNRFKLEKCRFRKELGRYWFTIGWWMIRTYSIIK